jgi:hypothetical protein
MSGARPLRESDMTSSTTHIYLNPVRTDRVTAFEQFLAVVHEAVDAQRPDLAGRWQVLKATAPESGDPGLTTYAFLFDGGDLETDWDLEVLLPAHFGAEEAERLMSAAADTFAPYHDWVAALGDHDGDMPQVGWTFTSHAGGA